VHDIAYDQAKQMVSFGLQNFGTQEITAFSYSLTVSKPGSEPLVYTETIDLLPLFSHRSLGPLIGYSGSDSFRPGETYSVHSYLPTPWGDLSGAPVEVRATAVVYADCSAVGDDRLIEHVFKARESGGRELKEILRAVKAIPRDEAFPDGLKSVAESFGAHSHPYGLANSWSSGGASLAANFEKTYERLGYKGFDILIQGHELQADAMLASSKRKEK
jgi:hypothetical protein